MNEIRLSRNVRGSIPAVLADIAHELSSIQDWQSRVENALCLVSDLLPNSLALFGAECEDWQVFSCEDQQADLQTLEPVLVQHFEILTGEEQPSVLMRVSGGYPGQQSIRETSTSSESFLSMPAIGADRVVGVLHVRSDDPDAYSLEDVSLVSVVASQLGSYLANVMAYLREQTAKNEIERLKIEAERHVHFLQQALVPTAPSIGEGYDVASVYIPGMAGQEIGGDFFDVFETEDGKVAILIGDVSGKGIPAAALAAATRSTVRAFAYELSSPGRAMTHANSVLSRHQIAHGSFVTVFLAVLEPSSGDIMYASAGHPPGIIYHNGEAEMLGFGHPPFGVFDRHKYSEAQAHLEPGDRIVMYTDGITEARRGGILFGTEGVEHILKENAGVSADDLIGRLLAEAAKWGNGKLSDDAAVIVVDRQA